jgi:hypothetical protein
MASTYIDKDGFMVRDYNADSIDVAKMGVAGYNRFGTPVLAQTAPVQTDYDNYAANGWTKTPQGYAPPQTPGYAGVLPRASTGVAMQPLPGAAVVPAMQAQPGSETDRAQLANNNAEMARLTTWANNPVTGITDPIQLAQAQRTRVAHIVGGTSLLNQITNGTGAALSVGGGDVTSPDLLNGQGKKPLGDSRLNLDLINDPRFKRMQAMNPDNAARFYEGITGRNLSSDVQAQLAQMASQREAQDKLATEVGQNLMVAPKDQPELGIKAGDFVKRVVQPGLLPGTVAVGMSPLSLAEKQTIGIGVDGTVQGNSMFHRATGLYGNVDVAALARERDALMAKSRSDNAAQIATAHAANWAPTGNKMVPLAQQSTDSGFNRDVKALTTTTADNSAFNSVGRFLSNRVASIHNYLTGSNYRMFTNNTDYENALAAYNSDPRNNGRPFDPFMFGSQAVGY